MACQRWDLKICSLRGTLKLRVSSAIGSSAKLLNDPMKSVDRCQILHNFGRCDPVGWLQFHQFHTSERPISSTVPLVWLSEDIHHIHNVIGTSLTTCSKNIKYSAGLYLIPSCDAIAMETKWLTWHFPVDIQLPRWRSFSRHGNLWLASFLRFLRFNHFFYISGCWSCQ